MRLYGIALVALALVGCGGTEVSLSARSDLALRVDSEERRYRENTYRIRVVRCDGVATGTGFSLYNGEVVTNRHVVEGARQVEVESWDGQVSTAQAIRVSRGADIAVITVDVAPGFSMSRSFEREAPVTIVGYPQGRWFMGAGTIVDVVAGSDLEPDQPTLRIDASVQQGNSGGPVLNSAGDVVGVLYGASGPMALAVPVDTVLDIPSSSLTMVDEC